MSEKKVAVLGIIVVALVIAIFAMQVLYYSPILDRLNSQVNTQQIQLDSKDAQISNLNSQIDNLQSQIDSKDAHITNLNSEIDNLQSQIDSNGAQISNLNSQIDNLQSQLLDATALIAQLQGPTGILPTYMDLGWEGEDTYHGNYFLQLSLKNTETLPITQIYVTLDSVQIPMAFTYLNTTVNVASPLPSYQTAIGIQDVTPPVTHPGTYPLVIQAITNNGTIYTYQTTITSHVGN
jgi:uncharacterized phage infection (PIP) family protein YhgE